MLCKYCLSKRKEVISANAMVKYFETIHKPDCPLINKPSGFMAFRKEE
jgi:hypothetical protein